MINFNSTKVKYFQEKTYRGTIGKPGNLIKHLETEEHGTERWVELYRVIKLSNLIDYFAS